MRAPTLTPITLSIRLKLKLKLKPLMLTAPGCCVITRNVVFCDWSNWKYLSAQAPPTSHRVLPLSALRIFFCAAFSATVYSRWWTVELQNAKPASSQKKWRKFSILLHVQLNRRAPVSQSGLMQQHFCLYLKFLVTFFSMIRLYSHQMTSYFGKQHGHDDNIWVNFKVMTSTNI